MTRGLYYYKLVSPYPEDVTKNCKLTINEIDSNFFELKNEDIKSAEIVRNEDDTQRTLVLTRNDGEQIIVDLKAIAFDLNVNTITKEDGSVTLTIAYSGADGKKSITIDNIITLDGLMNNINSKVLTKVITDSTLTGDGTVHHPLGLSGTFKTGVLAPVKAVIDLTNGGYIPEAAALGTRYVTKEYVNDYGYLYNGAGVAKISERISNGWRVPEKKDWDALLNSLEPCKYKNHGSAKCHVELGLNAGAYLKSECGWNGQPECSCAMDKPVTGSSCLYEGEDPIDASEFDDGTPSSAQTSYIGIDKYGMKILAAGSGNIDSHNRISTQGFSEEAYFWTTSHICDDPNQDVYVKQFVWNMSGVEQTAECPRPYFSVRLVKDYDGSNFFDSEYIDGVLYKTVLFPQSQQVWLAENYANKEGFVLSTSDTVPEVIDVNGGLVNERRKEFFINEWNGEYWEKRMLGEGETVIVENPNFDSEDVTIKEVCWDDKDGEHHCIDVEIPVTEQKNLEYRVYTDEDCDKVLINTDDLVTERIMDVIIPILGEETIEREKADKALDEKIEAETARAISAETELWEAIAEEASARTEVEEQLWDAIAQEASARTDVDNQLWDAIAQEASARTDVDNQIWTALNKEISDRLEVDSQMWAAINAEAEARETTDNLLWDAINAEAARAQEVEAQLWNGINGETARAQEVEAQLWDAINAEIERATARENEIDGQLIDWSMVHPFSVAVTTDTHNLVMETKDKNPEHFINIDFSGDFGEI